MKMQRMNLSQYSDEVVHWGFSEETLKCAIGLDSWEIRPSVEFEPRSNCSLGSECFLSSGCSVVGMRSST
jgi:hypothetical protein